MKRYRSERDDVRQKYGQLNIKYDQLKIEHTQAINRFQAERQREREELERVERSAHHLQTVLDNREFFLGPQISDENVRAQFNSIFSQIKTWSRHFTHGSVDTLRMGDDLLRKYQTVLPSCKESSDVLQVVAAKKERRLLVRGWAAFIACKDILTIHPSGNANGIDLWLDRATAESFRSLQQRLSSGKANALDDISR